MSSSAPPSAEALTKGTTLVSLRLAIIDLWGDSAWRDVVSRLPADAAETMTGGELTGVGWYPTRFAQACGRAAYEGPGGGREEELRRLTRRAIDLGFGRIRRALLRLATPELLATRGASLWRHDHSVGELTVELRAPHAAHLTLRDHPFVEPPLSQLVFAEAMRHVVSLSRVPNVRETHVREGDGLSVSLMWDAR
jgi:hypothetical protein